MKDLLTIIIPSKNEERYLPYLLLDLTYQKNLSGVKIILADCSTDQTRNIAKNLFKSLNIEIVEGGPVSLAKNNGAALATTPYLLFIDADVRFFSSTVIFDTVQQMVNEDLELIGLRAKCYDGDRLASFSFSVFNIVNSILSKKIPFAVGAYFLTKREKFEELGGFPNKYVTSEDFFLSKMYSPKKFCLSKHYFGQDSRRFKKMGYFGMLKYLIVNFLNRNNNKYWEEKDFSRYWD